MRVWEGMTEGVTDGILREVAGSSSESEFAAKLGPFPRGRGSRRKSFTPIILQNVRLSSFGISMAGGSH
jgi:hypothetical protein